VSRWLFVSRFRFSYKFPALSSNEGRDPLLWLPSSSKNLAAWPFLTLHKFVFRLFMRLSWGLVPFSVCGIRSLYFPDFHYLALSALALFRRFNGLLFLVPFGFISPRNTLGIFPTELSPLRDWFLLSKRFLAVWRPIPLYRWLLHAPDAWLLYYPGW